jgi:hypothetical protein
MNIAILLGGVALAVALFFGGFKSGEAVKQVEWDQERAARTDAALVRVERQVVEVPKIVTKVVTKTVTIEKEVERAQAEVEKVIPADCVLPDGFGVLLVAAAGGVDPAAPGAADGPGAAYGCREVLEATLADLKAGWTNSARLTGLQEWAHLVTNDKGATP